MFFENNENTSFLTKNHPSGLYYAVLSETGDVHYKAYLGMEESCRTGKPANVWGMSYWDVLKIDPEHASNFDNSMSSFTSTMVTGVFQIYDFSHYKSVVDVGGSQGIVVRRILEAYPSVAEGVTFDLPRTIENNKTLKRDLPVGRYHEVAGSFFDNPSGIPEGKDLYIMKQILHDWSDEESHSILESLHRAMGNHSKLILIEAVVPPGPEPSLVKWFDLHMLVLAGGKERTETQWRALLSKASFKVTNILLSPPATSVIEAVKA